MERTYMKYMWADYLVYPLFIIVALCAFLWVGPGGFRDEAQLVYIVNTASILVTLVSIYLGLKFMTFKYVRKKIYQGSLERMRYNYSCWYTYRVFIFMFAAAINEIAYVLSGDKSCLYCLVTVAVAYLFCYPSRKQLPQEGDNVE